MRRKRVASEEPAQGIGESLEISEMRVEVFHHEEVIHLPINMHKSISKSCHRTQRFLQIGWANAAFNEHGKGIGAVGRRTKFFRGDDMAGQV